MIGETGKYKPERDTGQDCPPKREADALEPREAGAGALVGSVVEARGDDVDREGCGGDHARVRVDLLGHPVVGLLAVHVHGDEQHPLLAGGAALGLLPVLVPGDRARIRRG